MTIIEKINSLENGRLMGVINSVDEGEGRTSTWAGSTGITTDEVKSLALALQEAEKALGRIEAHCCRIKEDPKSTLRLTMQTVRDEVTEVLATIKALKESE
jgi:hypothetical protein